MLPETKTCSKCKVEYPRSNFVTSSYTWDQKMNQCRGCHPRRPKSLVQSDNRRHRLRREYGMTVEDYDKMLADQGGGCAICGAGKPNRDKRYLPVDHCHATGKVRGILCGPCNTALGAMQDNVERLSAAITYLQASSTAS